MDSKKVLALMMGAIVASSGMSQMAVQVYANDEESSSSSYSYDDSIDIGVLDEEESSSSSEPMEGSPAVEELSELKYFKNERLQFLVEYKYLTTDLSNLYVSTSNLVFKPVSYNEAKLVCLDEGFEFDGDIVVPEKVRINGNVCSVTSIADGAFARCKNLRRVSLPESITRIGGGAFYFCHNLQLEQLPAGITKIGDYAFALCSNLELKSLPKGITKIGECTFFDCENLQLTSLPDDIKIIDRGAFSKCKNLQLEKLPESLEIIGECAFSGCEKLELASLPKGLRKISKRAFERTGIKIITIPASVAKLGDSAFETDSIEKINLEQRSSLNDNDIKRAYGKQLGKILGTVGKEEYLRRIREKILTPFELSAGEPKDACLVCGEKFNEENGEFGRLSCGHYMHLECFDDLVRNSFEQGVSFKCPICREEYNIF